MDEATASIDFNTETVIQKAIDKIFSQSTVLTIAHRIKTVMDYDRILILDKGSVLDFDTPKKLQEKGLI